ncbi:quinone oxidoreductase family protein [Microbacterium telephonicum]|uniref:NADPH:quinone reductase-like Zn-dependent oxidoreductase n=1 Tax=Microbacterium telephonicum TaxID=1714841 RepID=A0A498BZP0_9MICO|nr:zinc-binding dehydrogenase [Microbacterium telephonicum]RLK48922.1 NADPH:quinone reductase-like Zn-dependent oxidoreductase [Microbacterium telephonicum]
MTVAITHTALGDPDVLTLTEVDLPPLGPLDVAVRIEAAGVNPVDGKLRSGARVSPPITAPRHVGNDGAGVVTAVGTGVTGFRPGDAVVITGAQGTYASAVVVAQSALFPRPPQVSAAQGAALGIPIGTAYQTLRSLAVGPDDTVLVHAGSGAVGQAVVQFAVLAGATVIATTSRARADRVRQLGGAPIDYAPGIADRVREAAPQGVTVAIDLAGTDEALQSSLDLVADRSRIATLVRGADAAALGIQAFRGGSPAPLTEREEAWRLESIPVALALMAAGAFSVELGPELPLADAAEAHRLLESGTHGKIVLIP